MRPKEPRDSGQHDLLRSRLDQIIDTTHALAKLARAIDWPYLSQQLARFIPTSRSAASGNAIDGRPRDPQAHA